MRRVWLATGLASLALGAVGLFLPILPTVPFMILAAFCFARANRVWEARLLAHPVFGPHIRAWRERGAISLYGKWAGVLSLAASAGLGIWLLDGWVQYLPMGVAGVSGAFIVTRPTA
jgi:uncharacterized membrane protein YbaN (DUF454 family)